MNMTQTAQNFNPQRRNLLKLAPAATLAAMLGGATAVTAAPVSEIDAMFSDWMNTRAAWCQSVEESAEAENLWAKMTDLENTMVSIPARSAADLAKKLYAYCGGEVFEGSIKLEIAALVGGQGHDNQ